MQSPWKLHDAIREYGPESFSGEVVRECQTQAELNVVEKQLIAELNTMWPNGYNMRNGSQSTCDATRVFISERTRAAMADPDLQDHLSSRAKNRSYDEAIAVMAAANRGKIRPDHVRAKIRTAALRREAQKRAVRGEQSK